MDLGPPIGYEAIAEGTPVYSSDGEQIGKVSHVLADEQKDIFDGIVIAEHLGPRGHRFADVLEIGEIHERGVVLTLDRQAAENLPRPSPNPATMRGNPGERPESKLERAWNLLSGKY